MHEIKVSKMILSTGLIEIVNVKSIYKQIAAITFVYSLLYFQSITQDQFYLILHLVCENFSHSPALNSIKQHQTLRKLIDLKVARSEMNSWWMKVGNIESVSKSKSLTLKYGMTENQYNCQIEISRKYIHKGEQIKPER